MPKIFLSYRRADSQHVTDRIYDEMVSLFSQEEIFQDVDKIPFGVDFRDFLNDSINECDVVLVIIGTDWTRIMQERASQVNDFVRIEVESALKLKKLVIPVLVKNATMPKPDELPESIQPLCWLNAAQIRRNPDFRRDCQVLANGIKQWASQNNIPSSSQTVRASHGSPVLSPLESALEKARNFNGTRNTDWQPIIMPLGDIVPDTPIPELEMCLVPVGKFMMGAGKNAHPQTISKPYWIARYPVTNAQYRRAVESGGVEPPQNTKWYDDRKHQDAPVVYVNWFMSRQFAQWAKCDLPSELHWEYAARGVESLIYPWDDDWQDGKRVVWENNRQGEYPHPVTLHPEGASWIGAMHLSGNVWE